ncbi:hypothetical protein [Paenibacillus woosongensis]|uniref:hypothetical protein n=1 Tax=Paenibacillus woosongensis TaxID=307580 RepID=UPI0018C229FD|nr:hypothetical protein [Paenibacillus woosongensis]
MIRVWVLACYMSFWKVKKMYMGTGYLPMSFHGEASRDRIVSGPHQLWQLDAK